MPLFCPPNKTTNIHTILHWFSDNYWSDFCPVGLAQASNILFCPTQILKNPKIFSLQCYKIEKKAESLSFLLKNQLQCFINYPKAAQIEWSSYFSSDRHLQLKMIRFLKRWYRWIWNWLQDYGAALQVVHKGCTQCFAVLCLSFSMSHLHFLSLWH